MHKGTNGRILLYFTVVLSIVSAAYWTAYAVNNFDTFHEYIAMDYYAYNMYYNVAHPGVMSGIQMLVSGGHIAPDQLVVLLFYYMFPSPITILAIQALVLSLTAIIVFFLGRELLKSDAWGFALSIIYLLNPGIHGLLLIDYHAELFLIPFYLLVFFYYMKQDRRMFYLCAILLLGTIEVSVILTIAFGLGLYAFEALEKRSGWPRRMRLAMGLIALSVLALLAYNLLYYYIQSCYSSSCSSVPQFLRLEPWPGVPLFSSPLVYRGVSSTNFFQTITQNIYSGQAANSDLNYMVIYGLFIAFLSFGLATLIELPYLVISMLPWLVLVLLLGFQDYASIARQYFAYAIGATIVAAVLGLSKLIHTRRRNGGPFGMKPEMLRAFLFSSTLVLAFLIFIVSLFSYIPGTNWGPLQIYTFQTTQAQQQSYAQLNRVISLIPANASLMTQQTIFPHVMDRQKLELLEYTPKSFVPQYILVDTNPDFSPQYAGNISTYLDAYLANYSYSLYAENGTAALYKLSG